MPETNIKIRIADWEKDKEKLSTIRTLVFIKEQNVPEEMEWDEFDSSSTHFIAFEKDQAIACARLKPDGQIGRMAVLAEYRNKGNGKKLLQFVLQSSAELNFKTVYLHAQVTAVPFYEKQGFIAKGDVFYEANIPHREMLRKIC
jgi:predicted GNAT family N-acyltransferase